MPENSNAELHRLTTEIESVQGRFSHLLSITTVVMLVLAAGLVFRILPRMFWQGESLGSEKSYLPQLLCGLFALIVLLSCYIVQQRRHLRKTQSQLVSELVRRETAEHLSVIDPLTEIYNRRYMASAIARETARADRHNSKLAFLMIDVDGFKQTNDRLGHLVGDRILKDIAALLVETFRASDVISRYGGDEFFALLVDADAEQSDRAIERLQRELDKRNRQNPMQGCRVSLSCGSAIYSRGSDPKAVLAAADKAMYRCKQQSSQQHPVGRPTLHSVSRSAVAGA